MHRPTAMAISGVPPQTPPSPGGRKGRFLSCASLGSPTGPVPPLPGQQALWLVDSKAKPLRGGFASLAFSLAFRGSRCIGLW